MELALNSRMTEFHKANDIESLVDLMINHMKEQIENLAPTADSFLMKCYSWMSTFKD